MKIISYNISWSRPEKIKTLLAENADVYVIPEIAEEDLPSGFATKWTGVHFEKPFMGTKSKGLGIIWRGEKGNIPNWYKNDLLNLKYAIPLEYDEKLILAFWPTQDKTNGTYTKIAESIIEKYKDHLIGKDIIITGDFNLYYKPPKKNYAADIKKIDNILTKDLNVFSVYHKRNNIDFGNENKFTFFQNNNKDKSFFLDYTYTNIPLDRISYDFLDLSEKFGRNFSDHIGQVIEL